MCRGRLIGWIPSNANAWNRTLSRMGLLSACLFWMSPSPLMAQCLLTEDQLIRATDGDGSDNRFGTSISMSGDRAVVGAWLDDQVDTDAGAVYVLSWDGVRWNEDQKLVDPSGGFQDWFGCSVAIDGDVLAVGAIRDLALGPQSGAVHVFNFDGSQWIHAQEIHPSDAAAFQRFGFSVSLSEQTLLVGAPDDAQLGAFAGAAYIFEFDGTQWVETQKLLASDGRTEDVFGSAVSMRHDVALIGAPQGVGATSGTAYVFRPGEQGWTEEQKISPLDGGRHDQFGEAVMTDGHRLIIGALADDDNGTNSGSAYIFRYADQQWLQEQKLLAFDGRERDAFGLSVAIEGERAVVGAFDDDGRLGAAYAYRHGPNGWGDVRRLEAEQRRSVGGFGRAIDIEGDRALIGMEHVLREDDLHAFHLPEIETDASRDTVSFGVRLKLSVCGGMPKAPVLLSVVAINQIPHFAPISVGSFSPVGVFTFSHPVPPGVPQMDAEFQSFGLSWSGRLIPSSRARVRFE